jgi:Tol biopolymer transport system component
MDSISIARFGIVGGTLLCSMILASPAQGQPTQPAATDTADEKATLPLEAARRLRYTASEGTWLSVDVSPDGTTIVFDLLGDLYTMPVEGGTANRITSGMAFDAQPRYSPDGSRILFVSDRSGSDNLWTLDAATGDTTQVTKGNGNSWLSPDWTPDGDYVIASKGASRLGVTKLWIGHVDGGSGVQLHQEPENLKTVGGEVSRDGRYIWYARRNNNWDYNASFPQYQIGVYDRETGQDYARTSRYGSAFRPTLSPDGRWLVYGSRHEDETGLRIRDLQTGEERWLAHPVVHDDMESIGDRDVLPGMSFTPDSRSLIASWDGKLWRVPVEAGDPIEIPFRAEVDVGMGPKVEFDYVVDDSAQFTVRQIRDAVPSPDGARLAFIALARLYVMDWPGGAPRRLTESAHTEAQPTWSPDGEWIAYATWTPEGGHITKVRADGRGEPVQLTSMAATYQQPAWSPDGTRIVAVRGPARVLQEATGSNVPGAENDLVWVSADGGEVTTVAPSAGRSAPHFTGDGQRIHLYHGSRGLLSIRWDGTDEKTHVKVAGNTRPGAEQPNNASLVMMAPAGDRAVAQVNSDLYIVTVPLVGGETPTVNVANPENAAFPATKLTVVGGQFPAWSADGSKVHWSIGNAHFVYDIERARAFADSVRTAREAAAAERGDAQQDTAADAAEADSAATYEPLERRIVIRAPRDTPEGVAVLRGARVVTMNGDEVIENADIVIRDNRIAAVGPNGQVQLPDGAHEIDVTGTTVVPGFVDTHAHMWPVRGIHKSQVWMYLANLAYGVTTTRDPQTSTTDVITYGDLVDAGEILGPRVYSTGPGVFGDYIEDPIRDLDHARDIMKRYSEYYDTKTIKMYMAGNRQQRQWVIMAAKEQGIMPTTEGGLMLKYNLTMALDGYPGQEHSIPVYPLYEDVIRLFVESGIYYTPTLLVSYGGPWAENYWYATETPHDDEKLARFTPHSVLDASTRRRNAGWFMDEEHVFEDHAVALNEIVERGGRVGVGSHGQLQGLGYHWELWSMQSGGMSEHDALRAATLFGAEAIGLDGDLGSIQAGKLADLLVLDANPLDDIRNTNTIRFVMKNGRLYDGNTLDEVWPRQRPLEHVDIVAEEPANGR